MTKSSVDLADISQLHLVVENRVKLRNFYVIYEVQGVNKGLSKAP